MLSKYFYYHSDTYSHKEAKHDVWLLCAQMNNGILCALLS